jgi:hypothetical protein
VVLRQHEHVLVSTEPNQSTTDQWTAGQIKRRVRLFIA